jgi:hypothetical protein
MPGDTTADGTEITIREGHIPGIVSRTNRYTGKREDFDPNQVFTSPSIKYCAYEHPGCQPTYCDWTYFEGRADFRSRRFQVAFQLRQEPRSFNIGQETVGATSRRIKIDEDLENKELEYYTKQRGVHKIYRLLVRIHDDDDVGLADEPEPEPEPEPIAGRGSGLRAAMLAASE